MAENESDEMAEDESDELRIDKRPLEDLPDEGSVDEEEAEDVQGGMAPRYAPNGWSHTET
jgi:hypothetical protein